MRALAWKHRGWLARRWDLAEGDRVLATLRQRGWGMRADVDVGARRLRIVAAGLFRRSMRVVDDDSTVIPSTDLGWRGQARPTLADARRTGRPWGF